MENNYFSRSCFLFFLFFKPMQYRSSELVKLYRSFSASLSVCLSVCTGTSSRGGIIIEVSSRTSIVSKRRRETIASSSLQKKPFTINSRDISQLWYHVRTSHDHLSFVSLFTEEIVIRCKITESDIKNDSIFFKNVFLYDKV